jgi:alpha-tubulin suppressor-like RCC1 family protein
VTVTTETSGATIHNTTNGSEPTESDPTVASGGTLSVDKSKSLKVKAWMSGLPESGVGRGDYRITGALSLGNGFSVALKGDGTVWTWGTNTNGQLGLGSTGGTHNSPSQITSTSGFVAISAGTNHVVAVKGNGTVWAWGINSNGQLGDGSTTMRTSPVQVNTLTNVVAVSAGQYHSLALKADGTVWAWGTDNVTNYGTSPVQVSGLKGITTIAAKRNHSFALETDGETTGGLWVWGYDDLGWDTSWGYSDLGWGGVGHQAKPIRVLGMSNVSTFSAGAVHAIALKNDGTLWAWGSNNFGQLGDGGYISKSTAVQVAGFINTSNPVFSLSAGGQFTLLGQRKQTIGESQVWAWGNNATLSLGVSTQNSSSPTPVQSVMFGAFDTAAGDSNHAGALHLDGSVWTWGPNSTGQLGDGTTTSHLIPAVITGFTLVDNTWLLADDDADGLEAWEELAIGTDPGNADTNWDGITDGAEYGSALSATKSDIDGDGVSNKKERERGTDPFRVDTDDDGTNDSADCFPLDSSRQVCPSSNPSDTTPPSITLTRPTNATLTGSTP